MLVLTRKIGEQIIIAGDIRVTVTGLSGDRVKIGISAPPDVRIVRAELGRRAGDTTGPELLTTAP